MRRGGGEEEARRWLVVVVVVVVVPLLLLLLRLGFAAVSQMLLHVSGVLPGVLVPRKTFALC